MNGEGKDKTQADVTEKQVLPVDEFGNHWVNLKVDGETKDVLLSDLVAGSQKALAADKRFNEVASKRQELEAWAQQNQSKLAVAEALMNGIKNNDAASWRKALEGAGADEEYIQQLLEPPDTGEFSSSHTGDPDSGSGDQISEELMAEIRNLKNQVTALSKNNEKKTLEEQKAAIQKEIDTAIDTDKELSKLLEGRSSEGRKLIREMIGRGCAEASSRMRWGPEAIAEGIKLGKTKLAELGVKPKGPPVVDPVTGLPVHSPEDQSPGLGPSPYPASGLHRTTRDDKDKNIKVGSPDYAGKILRKMQKVLRKD